jgi:hypothetical protein
VEWITQGFSGFMRGTLGNGGQNLYVSAQGVLQRIYQFDVNADGYPDLLFANSQSMGERPPVYLYTSPFHANACMELPSNGTYDGLFCDITGDGFDDLVLACQNDGAHSDITAIIYFGNPDGLSEKYKMELPAPNATSVAAGDFNGDGKVDLAFVCSGQLRIFYQTDVGFHAPSYTDLPIAVHAIAAADLDGDGFSDLYVKLSDGSAQIFWGSAQGISTGAKTTVFGQSDIDHNQIASTPGRKNIDRTWRPGILTIDGCQYLFRADAEFIYFYTCGEDRSVQLAFALACPHALAVAAGDLDGDGLDDLAVAVCRKIDQTEDSLVFWNQSGYFNEKCTTIVPSVSAQNVLVVPLDENRGNGLVLCQGGTGILRSTESLVLSFTADHRPQTIAVLASGDAMRIVAGYPDKSGRLQLAVLNHETGRVRGDESVAIFLGGADGFQPDRKIELPGWAAVDGLMFDANDNGLVDVLVSNCSENAPHLDPGSFLYLQAENGFDPVRRVVIPTVRSHGCIVGDFRRCGYLDIATGGFHNRMISIFHGGPDGFDLDHPTRIVLGPDAEGYCPPPMSGEIDGDAAAINAMSAEDAAIYKEFGETRWLFSADFNQDGWLDLFVSQIIGPYCYILWGGPDGFSVQRMQRLAADGVASANAADLDGDGYLDLILAGHQSIGKKPEGKYESYITIYWGGPDGYQEHRKTQLPASCANAVTVGDFNGDGVLDIFGSAYHSGRCRDILTYVYYGRPGGLYSVNNRQVVFNHSGSGCVAGDFNGDGYADLAIACHKKYGNHLSESFVLWGGPDGLSETGKTILPTSGPHGMSIVDPGNIMDRSDHEYYESEICRMPDGSKVSQVRWRAEVPVHCNLALYLRQGDSPDAVQLADWSEPIITSGQDLAEWGFKGPWLQYRLRLSAPCGCGTPRVTEVVVCFDENI